MSPVRLFLARICAAAAAAAPALLLVVSPAAGQEPGESDAEALRRVEAMFEALGGRERWAEARSLYLHYHQWRTGEDARFQEEHAWRDLREPNERLEWTWAGTDGAAVWRGRGFSGGEVWLRGSDGHQAVVGSERDEQLAFWAFDFYTMFSRFARADEELTLRFVEPNRIEVSGADGADLGWWEIDARGNLMRWGATYNAEEELSYVYGPYRAFGDVAFPAWGVASDGRFRFEYADMQLSPAPLPDAVFDAPEAPPAEALLAEPLP